MHPLGGIDRAQPVRNLVLVGVVRRRRDFQLVRERKWYRVPARQKFRLRPAYLAFYLTKNCGLEGGVISHYASIENISLARRQQMLPDESQHPRAEEWYWQFHLGPLQVLTRRIVNRHRRRITFAYTTISRLRRAGEIGDLFDVPPLESTMEKLLRRSRISFIPQFSVMDRGKCRYRLDFALFCQRGKIALECDHSRWHRKPRQFALDQRRDRWLYQHGWTVMRFSEGDINQRSPETRKRVQSQVGILGGQ